MKTKKSISLSAIILLLCMIINLIPLSNVAASESNSEPLTLGVAKHVQIAEGESKYYSFCPTTTGFYTFQSSNKVSGDPKCWLYNNNGETLGSNDDGAGNLNFRMTYHLISGVTYYYTAGSYSSKAAEYDVVITNISIYSPNCAGTIVSSTTLTTTVAYQSYTYTFTPTETKEYMIYTQYGSGNAYIWLYDSSKNLIASNDNATYNRFDSMLTLVLNANMLYYLVLGHAQTSSGTYGVKVLKEKDITSNGAALKNGENFLYADIHGPWEQFYVHQWSFHPNQSEAWKIEKQDNGYYTIRSAFGDQKYIGVSGNSTTTNCVLLFDDIDYGTYWKAYENSDGGFILMPQRAPGCVLIPPNDYVGTELQLGWLFEVTTDIMYWTTEPRTAAELVGQKKSMWCWVAAALMFADHYSDNITKTQSDAVNQFDNGLNDGGTEEQIAYAIDYFIDSRLDGIPSLIYRFSFDNVSPDKANHGILSEANVIKLLDAGHVICITRTTRDDNGDRLQPNESHCTLITGYVKDPVTEEYQYIIYDSYPDNHPSPWNTYYDASAGKIYTRSYEWICSGRNAQAGEPADEMYWEGCVIPETDLGITFIPPVWDT